MRRRWTILLFMLFAAGAAWFGFIPDRAALPQAVAASPAAAGGVPAVPVAEGRAETRDVLIWLSGIGSVQPLNTVTVKVRVDGQLDRVAFTEGQDVHKGDALAQIDPRSFRAQFTQAQANKAKDEAQLANARLDLDRSTRLEAKGAASKQSLDTQRAQVAAPEATIEADQAAVEMAQLQVEFSTITAPLSGRTGLRLVDPGTVVHASDANGLVTITQMQPIAVLFSVSQDELPDVLGQWPAVSPSSLPIAGMANGHSLPGSSFSPTAKSPRAPGMSNSRRCSTTRTEPCGRANSSTHGCRSPP
jgi:multidrug efflux system membrane fusion protein